MGHLWNYSLSFDQINLESLELFLSTSQIIKDCSGTLSVHSHHNSITISVRWNKFSDSKLLNNKWGMKQKLFSLFSVFDHSLSNHLTHTHL